MNFETIETVEISTNELKSQLYFSWLDDIDLRIKLTEAIKSIKRCMTIREYAETLDCSQSAIKEVLYGTSKNYNIINNFINFHKN